MKSDQTQDVIIKFETLLTADIVEKGKQVKTMSYFVKKKKKIFTVVVWYNEVITTISRKSYFFL